MQITKLLILTISLIGIIKPISFHEQVQVIKAKPHKFHKTHHIHFPKAKKDPSDILNSAKLIEGVFLKYRLPQTYIKARYYSKQVSLAQTLTKKDPKYADNEHYVPPTRMALPKIIKKALIKKLKEQIEGIKGKLEPKRLEKFKKELLD